MYLLVSYDITDDRRRQRVMRLMLNYGKRLQKSVFECHLNEKQIDELKREIKALIKPREDRVRFWSICKMCIENIDVFGWGEIGFEEDEFWVV
ncbi:MAG: CRISPR-associated endonuclease Cas2 [Dissulfuribacterales bacterium]